MISSAAPPGPSMGVQAPPVPATQPVQAGAKQADVRAVSHEKPPPRVQFDSQKLQEHLQKAIEQLNEQLADSGRTLGFRMDEVLNAPVVTVKSSKTGEVIRQIPSEAVIKAAHTFEQLKGLLVDESS